MHIDIKIDRKREAIQTRKNKHMTTTTLTFTQKAIIRQGTTKQRQQTRKNNKPVEKCKISTPVPSGQRSIISKELKTEQERMQGSRQINSGAITHSTHIKSNKKTKNETTSLQNKRAYRKHRWPHAFNRSSKESTNRTKIQQSNKVCRKHTKKGKVATKAGEHNTLVSIRFMLRKRQNEIQRDTKYNS